MIYECYSPSQPQRLQLKNYFLMEKAGPFQIKSLKISTPLFVRDYSHVSAPGLIFALPLQLSAPVCRILQLSIVKI